MDNDQFTATISDTLIDGNPVPHDRINYWSETNASRLLILGKKKPSSSPNGKM